MSEEKTKITWRAETRKLADLKHWDKNPRKISPEKIEMLKERIRARGFHDIIKIDSHNVILSGNCRKEVLAQLEIDEVNVLVPNRELTKEEIEQIGLESNMHDGEFDLEKLTQFDENLLKGIGFDSKDLDAIFKPESMEDEFDAPAEYQKVSSPKSKQGDIFQLGQHRLMCGDSTKREDVEKLMGGGLADMVFTDPPYNVAYQGNVFEQIKNDDMAEQEFIEFSEKFIQQMRDASKPGAVFYICSGYSSFPTFLWALRKNNFEFSTPIIWVKNQTSFGFSDYKKQHEMIVKTKAPKEVAKAQPILYGWKEGKHFFAESRFEADVWQVKRRAASTMAHPTQKPLELIGRAIRNSSRRDEIILDLFGGSGSTLISAEKEGRLAYLMELDPKYVDVCIKRWETFTGQTAIKVT